MVVMMQLAWTQPLRTTSGEELEPKVKPRVLCVPNLIGMFILHACVYFKSDFCALRLAYD